MNHKLNDLLYFVNFKRKINSVNNVVTICETFYLSDDILDAKKLFFNLIGDKNDGLRFSSRCGDNVAKANMEDLVTTERPATFAIQKFVQNLKREHVAPGTVERSQTMFILTSP